jgi:hypothetical protein
MSKVVFLVIDPVKSNSVFFKRKPISFPGLFGERRKGGN